MRSVAVYICLLFFFRQGYPQDRLFIRQDILDQIREGIDKIYNYEFETADSIFRSVETKMPGHPVNPFLKGFTVYWEANPLTPFDRRSGYFVACMEESARIAQLLTAKDPEDIEGIFFDLAANAMLLLYYADNGFSREVLLGAMPTYRLVKKGFDLDKEFAEFRFFTGVYNYYREVYPVIHPVYKPISVFFPPGSKETGWEMLLWIKDNSVFLRAEALYFLSHIAMSMEDDPELSLKFSKEVLDLFPRNNFFRVRHTLGLNSAGKYKQMRPQIEILLKTGEHNRFSKMAGLIFKGIVLEKLDKNYAAAEQNYLEGLEITEEFGIRVDNYAALAYLGLYRICTIRGESKLAREHWKKAKSLAKYDYILKDQ